MPQYLYTEGKAGKNAKSEKNRDASDGQPGAAVATLICQFELDRFAVAAQAYGGEQEDCGDG